MHTGNNQIAWLKIASVGLRAGSPSPPFSSLLPSQSGTQAGCTSMQTPRASIPPTPDGCQPCCQLNCLGSHHRGGVTSWWRRATVSVLRRRGLVPPYRNPHEAICHFRGAEAGKPLSPCCLTGLCLHSRQIPENISYTVPPGQYSARAKATPSELRMLVSTLFCQSIAKRPTTCKDADSHSWRAQTLSQTGPLAFLLTPL